MRELLGDNYWFVFGTTVSIAALITAACTCAAVDKLTLIHSVRSDNARLIMVECLRAKHTVAECKGLAE